VKKFARGDPLRVAQWFWHKLDIPRDLSIPRWYSNLYGTSPWYTTKKISPKQGEKMRALAFIVRMNYILDTNVLRDKFVGLPSFVSRPMSLLGLSYHGSMVGMRSNVTWAHAPMFNWRRALSCTLRVFVNLTYPFLGSRYRTVGIG